MSFAIDSVSIVCKCRYVSVFMAMCLLRNS